MADVLSQEAQRDVPVPHANQWEVFAEYVRANPGCLSRTPDDLAREFELDVDFVRSFVAAMRTPIEQDSFLEVGARAIKEAFSKVITRVKSTFVELTGRPWLCLMGSTLTTFAVVTLLVLFRNSFQLGVNFLYTGAAGALVGALFVMTFITHSVCYYRHAQMRYAFAFSAVMLMAWFAFMNLAMDAQGRAEIERNNLPALPLMIFGAIIMSALYFLFAMTATLSGGYARYRRESMVEREVSRQELLDRLFEVNSRLGGLLAADRRVRARFLDRIRTAKTYYLNVLLWGIAVGMLDVLIFGLYSQTTGHEFSWDVSLPWAMIIAGIGLTVIKYGFAILSGFIAGRPARAMSAVIAFGAGLWFASFFPLGTYGFKHAIDQVKLGNIFMCLIGVVFIGLVTGYAALVEERNYRDSRLRNDDPASLLAQQIQIQWRLGLGSQATTVLVVDVAKSTTMKANADPLKIEWSFREYQSLIEEKSLQHGGQVLSTAGDGAVVGFPSPQLAVIAAREILTEMPRFNMRRNRLTVPFRIRIGIHTGRTEANLVDAPFNEIIDIAAHIEGVAPIGGIAVSKAVADAVTEGTDFGELAHQVDGQQVYVVLNPTVDA